MPSSRPRERFSSEEALAVLRQTGIERVERVTEFPRGSSRSPKIVVACGDRRWLVKRRAPVNSDPERVRYCQHFQRLLAEASLPVPPPLPFASGQTSLLLHGQVYEYFDFVEGGRYAREASHAMAAGEALGRLLRAASRCRPRGDAVHGSFHGSGIILGAAKVAPEAIFRAEPDAPRAQVERQAMALRRLYRDAAQRAMLAGFAGIGVHPIHGDFHPGNLLFGDESVVGIVDFDAARTEPRAVEVANALLQFGALRLAGDEVASWPVGLDPLLVSAMIAGLAKGGLRLESRERSAVPWLMIEACIAEGVVPIARTGAFADLPGSQMLSYVLHRAESLAASADSLLVALCA